MQWALVIFAMVIFAVAVAAVIWLARVLKVEADLRLEVADEARELARMRTLLELEQQKTAGLERALKEVRSELEAIDVDLAKNAGLGGRSVAERLRARLSEKGL